MNTSTIHVINRLEFKDFLLIALLLIPGITHILHTGDWVAYFRDNSLDGQFLYILSKLIGLYAIVLLWLQLMSGLLRIRLFDGWRPLIHRNLGLVTLSLVVLHVTLFVAGVSIRNGHFAYKLLLPNLFGHYFQKIVALGVIALWLLIIATVCAVIRNRLPIVWKWGHRMMLVVFALGFMHSYLIGSEARSGGMLYLYYVMGISGMIAWLSRIFMNKKATC